MKDKNKKVSGGKIWKAIDFNLIGKRYFSMFIIFCVGVLAVLAADIHNFPKINSTETYYIWNTPPILQSNTISFWVSFALLSIGAICLLTSVILLLITPDPNSGSKIKFKSGDVVTTVMSIFILFISFVGSTAIGESGRLQASWIYKTYDVTVADWKQILPVKDKGQVEVATTDKSGAVISLTLKFEDNKMYVTNQEKLTKN
jgi:hypothetical protein